MTKDLPSPELLRKLLRYEPETGRLFWRERTTDMFSKTGCGSQRGNAARWNSRYALKDALTVKQRDGYFQGIILGRSYLAHRVIWAVHFGSWPSQQIDHINGNRADNRIENLREVSSSENSQNSKKRKDNTSGFKGVSFDTRSGRWQAQIMKQGKSFHLGFYNAPEEASKAYIAASNRLHGEFARVMD